MNRRPSRSVVRIVLRVGALGVVLVASLGATWSGKPITDGLRSSPECPAGYKPCGQGGCIPQENRCCGERDGRVGQCGPSGDARVATCAGPNDDPSRCGGAAFCCNEGDAVVGSNDCKDVFDGKTGVFCGGACVRPGEPCCNLGQCGKVGGDVESVDTPLDVRSSGSSSAGCFGSPTPSSSEGAGGGGGGGTGGVCKKAGTYCTADSDCCPGNICSSGSACLYSSISGCKCDELGQQCVSSSLVGGRTRCTRAGESTGNTRSCCPGLVAVNDVCAAQCTQ